MLKRLLFLLPLAVLFLLPTKVSAAPACTGPGGLGGQCQTTDFCNLTKAVYPGTEIVNGTDCYDPNNSLATIDLICCVPPVQFQHAHCTEALGGTCRVGSCQAGEDSHNQDDCTAGAVCCTPQAPTCDALQGRFCALDCAAAGGDTLGFDCGSPGLHCCHQKYGSQCELNGGHCATQGSCSSETNEESIGRADCQTATLCCRPATAVNTTPGSVSGTPAAPNAANVPQPPGTLFAAIQSVNPGTLTCIQTGNCSVDDIVYAGVGFAKFLMGLSGALFFIIFIYGGAMYLMSFGEKSRVDKAKKAITGAAIGIVIVAGAWTIVSYIVGGITGTGVGGGSSSSAPAASPYVGCGTGNLAGYSCKTFSAATNEATLMSLCLAAGNDCVARKCSGPKDLCAKAK